MAFNAMEMKTVGDVYDPLKTAAMLDEMEGRRYQNRINAMNLQLAQEKFRKDQTVENILKGQNAMSPQGQPTPQTLDQIQQADPRVAMEMRQGQAAQQQAQQKAVTDRQEAQKKEYLTTVIKPSLEAAIEQGDNETVKKLNEQLNQMFPDFHTPDITVIGKNHYTVPTMVVNGKLPDGTPAVDVGGNPVKDGDYSAIEFKGQGQNRRIVKATPGETANGMKDRYIAIQTKQNMKQPVSKEDLAWKAAYEKQLTMTTQTRIEGLKELKAGTVFDLQTGKMQPGVSLQEQQDHPERYLSPQDPNVKQLNRNVQFDSTNRTFVNQIDRNIATVEKLAKKYGGNNLPQFLNTPINQLERMMGSGDFAALRLALTSTTNEVAKVESGSLGVRGADVAQFAEYHKSLNENMQFGQLKKVLDTAKGLGTNRIDSITEERIRLKEEMGAPFTAEETRFLARQKEEKQPAGKVLVDRPGFKIEEIAP